MQVPIIMLLRIKYSISRDELRKACGISNQRICEIELKGKHISGSTKEKLKRGLELVIQQRQDNINALKTDYQKHKETLYELVEETTYEL